MTLTIDIGNTSTKFALYQQGELVVFGRLQECWESTLTQLLGKGEIECALISNVAGPQPELIQALDKHHIPAQWLTWTSPEVTRFLSNIPEGMGADRLAADIAARQLFPNEDLLVVDAGTCITFDVIRKNGSYAGGSISPGIGLRLKAMHDYTAALPLLQPEGEAPVVGTDIYTAMRGGCVNGLKWEIEGYIRYLKANFSPTLRTFYTGGNNLALAEDVEESVIHDSMLVMKGLLAAYSH